MRGYAAVALWNAKTSHNIGGVFRAAGCYSADLIVVGGVRRVNYLKYLSTDTQRAWRHIPVIEADDPFDVMPLGSIPVAVDLVPGAYSLVNFVHPQRAFYIFGPEDGTLRERITSRCKYKVMVPTTMCMNLAATVNVILYDRLAKQQR